jgi:hypothetical protein
MATQAETDPKLQNLLDKISSQLRNLNQEVDNVHVFENDEKVFSSTMQGELKLPNRVPAKRVGQVLETLQEALVNPQDYKGRLSIYLGERLPENELLRIEEGVVVIDKLKLTNELAQQRTSDVNQEALQTVRAPKFTKVSDLPTPAEKIQAREALYKKYSNGIDTTLDPVTFAEYVALNAIQDGLSLVQTRDMIRADAYYKEVFQQSGDITANRYATALVNNVQENMLGLETPQRITPSASEVEAKWDLAEKINELIENSTHQNAQISQLVEASAAKDAQIARLTEVLEALTAKLDPENQVNHPQQKNAVYAWLGKISASIHTAATDAIEAVKGYVRPIVYDGLDSAHRVAVKVLGVDTRPFTELPGVGVETQGQLEFNSPDSPQELWDKYSHGMPETNPVDRSVGAALTALREGESCENVLNMLKFDPEYSRIQEEQDTRKADQNVVRVLNSAQGKLQARGNPIWQQAMQAVQRKEETLEIGA